MRERPILFSSAMVRAILDGTKTQTRRVVKPRGDYPRYDGEMHPDGSGETWIDWGPCPYGAPGDLLWVREAWGVGCRPDPYDGCWVDGIEYRADEAYLDEHDMLPLRPFRDGFPTELSERSGWRPSIHMPRWASRISLEVTSVRVERVQDISEEDAIAEGLARVTKDGSLFKYGIADRDGLPGNDDYGWSWKEWEADPRQAYRKLWDQINGRKPGCAWSDNPWVWVVSFKRVTP